MFLYAHDSWKRANENWTLVGGTRIPLMFTLFDALRHEHPCALSQTALWTDLAKKMRIGCSNDNNVIIYLYNSFVIYVIFFNIIITVTIVGTVVPVA